ncbi:MAG TPA: undecaprenyl-diphosphate phosphatase [Dongiaceae bacterium]
MPNIDILIFAIIRGVAEILPIDAPGHLTLGMRFFCWQQQPHFLVAAANAGVLAALLLYFWRDSLAVIRSLGRVAHGKRDARALLIAYALLASLPPMLIVFLLRLAFDVTIRDPLYIGVLMVAFGVVLYVADQIGLTVRRLSQMNAAQASIIGLFQGLVLLPGISRVGIAITVARMLGYERLDAARFTLLISIPWMAAAALYHGYFGFAAGETPVPDRLIIMAVAAAVSAFVAITFLMYWLRQGSFTLFVLYRVVLGGLSVYLIYAAPGFLCAAAAG